jgi:AcrR family transcriptional regulator
LAEFERPRKVTDEKIAMRERGDMSMSAIARSLGVGRTTLYEYLETTLANRPQR